MASVLFVCTGNTCRSPMAEVLARDYFSKRSASHTFFSRGTNVYLPGYAEQNAVLALEKAFRLSLDGHIATQLNESDLLASNMVLTMTKAHADYLVNLYPIHSDKIITLSEMTNAGIGDIPDPFGQNIAVYTACAEAIYECIKKLVPVLD